MVCKCVTLAAYNAKLNFRCLILRVSALLLLQRNDTKTFAGALFPTLQMSNYGRLARFSKNPGVLTPERQTQAENRRSVKAASVTVVFLHHHIVLDDGIDHALTLDNG